MLVSAQRFGAVRRDDDDDDEDEDNIGLDESGDDGQNLPGRTGYSGVHARASAGLLQVKEEEHPEAGKYGRSERGSIARGSVDDDWQEFDDIKWSENHAKLLYLISKYAYPARTGNEKETWIREIPLLVMIYEGIIAGVLDFDYAPVSVLVSQNGVSKRCFMNVTQEGKSAIDDLRERRLMNGLKLSSEDFQPVSCYQVSFHGLDFLERIPQKLRSDVDGFIYAPKPYQNKLLNVIMRREINEEEDEEVQNFYLVAEGGYERISGVTDIEDVSYVSSPFLPLIVRTGEKALRNNSHRASEAASGESNIKDELSEAIHLANVKILVGEWIPFGPNQIVALNERLGAMDRCQGGLFTSKIDTDPTSTQFQVPTGLTQVRILDYDLTHCINFEAEINYPEAEGIVQIENFGMHLNVDGTILYGMGIEAIMERKADDISLDMLSRLLVDVQKDSSTIINDLLSAYQRALLSMVFCNDEMNRCKYNLVLCESIDPKLQCEEYIDRGDNENELKQVIGDIQSAHNVGSDDILILGREGLVLAGPNGRRYEKLILLHLSLLVREMFVRVFFIRTYVLDDSLKRIRKMILEHEKDPNNVPKLRIQLNDTSRDIILLEEIISYLLESLNSMEVPAMPDDEASATLFKALNLSNMKRDVTHRVEDLRKLVHGAQNELQNLSSMTEMINTKQLEEIFRNVESNTKYLVDGSGTNERASASLEVMQMMLAGMLAFDVIDHISGGTLGLSTPWWVEQWINQPIVAKFPFLWFALNLLWMLLFVYGVTKFMRHLSDLSTGFLTLHVRINAKINVEKMEMFLSDKRIDVTDTIEEPALSIKKVAWQERDRILWAGGSPPKIEVAYDAQNGFLLTVLFTLDKKKSSLDEDGLMRIFTAVLAEHGVLEDYEPPRTALYDMEDRGDDKDE